MIGIVVMALMMVIIVMMITMMVFVRMISPLPWILIICRIHIQGVRGYIFPRWMMTCPHYDVGFFIELTTTVTDTNMDYRNRYGP